MTATLQRFAPEYVIALEEQILGAIMQHPETFSEVEHLSHTAFSVSANRQIFVAAREIFECGCQPSLMQITAYLHDRSTLADIGGQSYLAYLISCCPSINRLGEHAELLEEAALKRELANITITDNNFDEVLEKLQRIKAGRKKDQKADRIRLELQMLATESDPIKQIVETISFCQRHGWSKKDVEQQVRSLKAGYLKPQATLLDGSEFLSLEAETIRWIFPGIVPGRGVCVLGGNAGAGKTTLACDAVGSLLLDEEFLGERPAIRGRVLIVSADELSCYTQDKLIERGIPRDNRDWKILLNWDVSQWDALVSAVEEFRPTLIVIDSFASVHRDALFDENTSQAKNTIYDLEALTNRYDCGCILLHHLSKSKDNHGVSRLRGSSAIAAAASVVCLMEQNADGTRKLTFPKVRGAQTEPFTVDYDNATGRYQVLSGGEAPSVRSLSECVLEFLQQNPARRFEQEEISHALGLSPGSDALYQALSRLFRRGLIVKRPSAVGGRRKVYGIPAPEIEAASPPPSINGANVRNEPETIDIQGFQVPDSNPDTLTDLVEKQRKQYQYLEQQPDGAVIPFPIPDTFPDNPEKKGGDSETEEMSDWEEGEIEYAKSILADPEQVPDAETFNCLRELWPAKALDAARERLSLERQAQIREFEMES